MLDTPSRETISPNSVTQGKDSEPFQGRGLSYRWQRPKTDGTREDLEENDDEEWGGPGDTGTRRLWIEEEDWYRKSLNTELSPAIWAEDTGTEVVAHLRALESQLCFCALKLSEENGEK